MSPYANSHAIDTLSNDSDSTDEGVQGNCPLSHFPTLNVNLYFVIDGLLLVNILKVKAGMHKLYDIDSRVGLNGSRSLWSF